MEHVSNLHNYTNDTCSTTNNRVLTVQSRQPVPEHLEEASSPETEAQGLHSTQEKLGMGQERGGSARQLQQLPAKVTEALHSLDWTGEEVFYPLVVVVVVAAVETTLSTRRELLKQAFLSILLLRVVENDAPVRPAELSRVEFQQSLAGVGHDIGRLSDRGRQHQRTFW